MRAKHNPSVGDDLSFILQVDPSSCQVVDSSHLILPNLQVFAIENVFARKISLQNSPWSGLPANLPRHNNC